MASLIRYNPISPQCTIVPCLNQVAGYADGNPAEQLAGCQSVFGFPVVPTVTLPVDPVLSTIIDTSTYTDIVISTSTVYSTLEETSTSYETVPETATAYTTTVVNTIKTTVAPATVTVAKRGSKKRRSYCKPRTSTTTTTTSSSALFPLASDCPSRDQYSSACACLEPTAVTEYVAALTSVIRETLSTTVQSTTDTVITLAITTVIVNPATTTLTSTLTTLTSSTATATETSTPSPPAVPTTFGLVLNDGPNAGKSAVAYGSVQAPFGWVANGPPTQLGLNGPNTAPFLAGNPAFRMYVRTTQSGYGSVVFTTPAYIASWPFVYVTVTCSLSPDTLVMSCSTRTPTSFTRLLQCGSTFYMANAVTTPTGCLEVHLKVAT